MAIAYLSPPTRGFVGELGTADSAVRMVNLVHPDDLDGVMSAWERVAGRPGAVAELRGRLRR